MAKSRLHTWLSMVSATVIAFVLAVPTQAATTPRLDLSTNRALYSPTSPVILTAATNATSNLKLRIVYWHGNTIVATRKVSADNDGSTSWAWIPPITDFQGYLVQVKLYQGSKQLKTSTIGVDVSSDWGRYPRYGFLSEFAAMDQSDQLAVISYLNRYHINGLQFYDWQDRHDRPLPVVEGTPLSTWQDIALRETAFTTVERYISLAHQFGMQAMNYNLIMGGYADYQTLGVSREWGIFTDQNHETQDTHPLPDSWESALTLFNPANPDWQDFLINQENVVNNYLNFDGWHVDQLGSRTAYDYNGNPVDLAVGYASFLNKAKAEYNKQLIMNAVDQYGQTEILGTTSTKFAYAELWAGNESFSSLLQVVQDNWTQSAQRLNTVFAAYINRDISSSPGSFNSPGVLLANAAMLAVGGTHLELGEHMLSNEYFPNANLNASNGLLKSLESYYDFEVAYENFLRDRVVPVATNLKVKGHEVALDDAAYAGTIWAFSRKSASGKTRMIHLINLERANSDLWRDANGDMPKPKKLSNLTVQISYSKTVSKVWLASPDISGGLPTSLKFTQKGKTLTVTVPSLTYWDMLVIQ